MKLKALFLSPIAAVALAFAPAANSALLTAGDNVYDFSWSFFTGSYNLTGHGSVTVTGFNSDELTLEFTLSNTSPNSGQGGDRLTSFGFGIDPDATSVTFIDITSGGLTSAGFVSNGTLAANVQGVEICAWGGPNCNGGGNGGIYAGASDSFQLLLGGLRYQTGDGSFSFPTGNGTPVPEPGALALLGLGLLGLAAVRRRRTNVA